MSQRSCRARLAMVAMVAGALLSGCNTTDRAAQDTTLARDTLPAATGAVGVGGSAGASAGASATAMPPAMPPAMPGDTAAAAGSAVPEAAIRLEVDINARQLRLLRGEQVVATHPVAVGSTEWPTRTGQWHVTQVVWNPEWVPPDESWAEQRKPRKPGDPANPLGHAQLVYDPPRSIHGTNDSASIGKAVSHGSIRVTNSVAKRLARQLMEETGVAKDEAWYRSTQQNRTVKQIVDLPQRVPIRVF